MRGPARRRALWLAGLLAPALLAGCEGGGVERGAERILARAEVLREAAVAPSPAAPWWAPALLGSLSHEEGAAKPSRLDQQCQDDYYPVCLNILRC
jgi:4'-phosphopantetheinyl transferase EntD